MQINDTALSGVKIIEPNVFGDNRGFFLETWQSKRYVEKGIDTTFIQDNLSSSKRGVLRGLHCQSPNFQGKLIYVLQGEVWDVIVDIRKGSPEFGKWIGVTLSSENKKQVYIPPGFAHGFCVTSETALFAYKCTEYYSPENEFCILWSDPDIGIEWPDLGGYNLSERDKQGIRLCDVPEGLLPSYPH